MSIGVMKDSFVYYESKKRELKTRPIYECWCDEKGFRTVWKELVQEFPVIFDQCAEQTL
jgi:hypothetical protein